MINNWKEIWGIKYRESAPSHVMDGFDNLTLLQWKHLVNSFYKLIDITADSDILDIGCGSGAFLEHIKKYKSISGVDYSKSAISQIKNKIKGNFQVAEAANLPFEENSFNIIICFSVFFYFPSLMYAEKVINEMMRVCKPRGQIFIGDINDADKRDLYNTIREKENRDKKHLIKETLSEHMFYDKEFFKHIAKKNGFQIQTIDEDKLNLSFYNSSMYRYSVIYNL